VTSRWKALPLLALGTSLLLPCAARADEPPLPHITVVPADALNGVVLGPDQPSPISASVLTITVRNANNVPVTNAVVQLETPGPTLVRFCSGQQSYAVTDGQGVAVLTLRGGGCAHGTNAAILKVNGLVFRAYTAAKSPDWDGASADGVMNLADFLAFRSADLCHDYDNNGHKDLADTIIFASAYLPPHQCALQP
jgi:hypothetical protein